MKNTLYFLLGFTLVIAVSVQCEASEREKKAFGVYINSYTGTKVAVCTGSIENCEIEYLTGNSYRQIPLDLHIFKNPIRKYEDDGKINKRYNQLFENSHIVLR